MARLHSNAVSGILSAPLTNNGTSMSAAALANLIAVTGSDTALVVLDPEGAANGPEAVWVTAHTASATTATISRAAETGGGLKATGQAHASGTKWVHALSVLDVATAAITGGTITGITDLAVADGGTGASTASGARTNLGLDTMATQAASAVTITGGTIAGITDLPVADGGTGSSTAAGARTNLGLGTLATKSAIASADITDGTIVAGDCAAALFSELNGVVKTHVDSGGPGQTTVTATSSPGTTLPMKTTHAATITRSGQVLVVDGIMNVEYTGGGGGGDLQAAVCELFVDGVKWTETEGGETYTPQIIGYGHVAGILFRLNVSMVWVVTGLSVGTHTLTLRAYKLGSGDTVKVDDGHSCIVSDRRG